MNASASDVWQQLDVGGPGAKLLDFHGLEERSDWWLGVGGGHLWFDGAADLDDAPAAEVRLGRRFGDRQPVDCEIFLTYAETRMTRPWSAVRLIEVEIPNPEFPSGEPIIVEVAQRLEGTTRLNGRLWHLGAAASPQLLAGRIGSARLELLARGGVFVAVADFDHDSGVGAGVLGGVQARARLGERLAIDAGFSVQYADYAVEGLGATASAMAAICGSWWF